MNKLVLYQYINKIKKEDIIKYGLKEDIVIDKDDLEVIYNYIKNDYKRIIDNPLEVLCEIKDKVSGKIYIKILELYDKYKSTLEKMK